MTKIALFSAAAGFFILTSAFTVLTPGKHPATNKMAAPVAFVQGPANWTIDKAHTNVRFSVAHLVVSDVDGSFKSFDGSMTSAKPDFSDAVINFSVNVSSINTDNEMRDKHLKSDDFFNAEKFPQIKFTS